MCFKLKRALPCGILGLRRGRGSVHLCPTQVGVFSSRKGSLIYHTLNFPTSQLWTAACWRYLFALFYDGKTEQHVFVCGDSQPCRSWYFQQQYSMAARLAQWCFTSRPKSSRRRQIKTEELRSLLSERWNIFKKESSVAPEWHFWNIF